MNVLVATDGSKYGQWGLNWVAALPFVKPAKVTALHVLDSAWLRGPFRARPIQHATCPVLVVKGEAVPLRRMIFATDGSSASATAMEFVLSISAGSFNRQGRTRTDSRARDPYDGAQPLNQVSEAGQQAPADGGGVGEGGMRN